MYEGNRDYSKFSKYVTDSQWGVVDGKSRLELEDDAAHAFLGGDWHIPTPEEFQEGCIPAAHFSLYYNPDHYIGANIAVEGTVLERRLLEDGNVQVFLEMNGDFLGLTKGLLCAVYSNALHGELPENGTTVTIYGMYKGVGEESYEGETRSLPIMDAEYVIAN